MATRGPLPDPNSRRRNAPTIPTTNLPAAGRKGRVPAVPAAYALKKAGKAWWRWAWKLPQAAAWDDGALYTLARRAQLEDDLHLQDHFDPFELGELLGLDDEHKMLKELGFVIGRLKSMSGGRLAILKEMRELDGKLGLNPEALAKLRWKIVDADKDLPTASRASRSRKKLPDNVRRLPAIDPAAAVG